MGSEAAVTAAIITPSAMQQGFDELERQRELISSCTHLWKQLSEHFSSLERCLDLKSDTLRHRRRSLDLSARRSLDSLRRREQSIDASVDLSASKVDSLLAAAAVAALSSPSNNLQSSLRSLCGEMDDGGFWDLVVSKRKEIEILKSELPLALSNCIDPARFAMDAVSRVFPVDRREAKSPTDLGWACVLILESLVPALADPELGESRPLVTRAMKGRAKAMADEWKEGFEQRGGIDGVRPVDVHAFLQHLATFGVIEKGDKEFYRKLVLGISWRRQMPKLALSVGLEDQMSDMIEELINKGQQLDAINFAYEAGLEDKFPPIPLLKSFLNDSKKAVPSNSEDSNNSSPTMSNAPRKEQSALRSVIKCIEDRKLEAEFPPESLHKRLEDLEKAKVEKKKPAGSPPNGPANKRTRVSNGGPMPPSKAGRLTNNAYVSSFPAIRSPSSHIAYTVVSPPYPYNRVSGHGLYGSQSPPDLMDPYSYPVEEVPLSYPPVPMNYPSYGVYGNGLAPMYQRAYYR